VRRIGLLIMSVAIASVVLLVSPASGQTDDTTTTVDPGVTTTVDPGVTTTVDPLSTTTTSLDVPLPGEAISNGTVTLGAQLKDKPAGGCQVSGSLAGQQMNLVRNEAGNIGAVYGKAQMGADTAGMLMIQLGPLPMAVIVYRSVGTCNQDVVGVGGFGATATTANFSGIGFAAFPGDFAQYVTAQVTVGGSGGAPNLDLQSASDFLTAPR
jgi:hypothetical protein